VNAVGACLKDTRELDTGAIVRSRIYTDRRESAWNESGELLIPLAEGAIGRDHLVGEIGEVLIGACPGRRSPEEITVFDSLGIAVEDVAVAEWLDARARAAGVGTMVALGGLRDA
jgi:ornithine cyclodeaminase